MYINHNNFSVIIPLPAFGLTNAEPLVYEIQKLTLQIHRIISQLSIRRSSSGFCFEGKKVVRLGRRLPKEQTRKRRRKLLPNIQWPSG